MSVLRNLVIVVLLICVAYNGYIIYRNQAVSSPEVVNQELSEAPLFSAEAFHRLAENRSHVDVQHPPTVVTAHREPTTVEPVANPVLESLPAAQPPTVVSASAQEPAETAVNEPQPPEAVSPAAESSPYSRFSQADTPQEQPAPKLAPRAVPVSTAAEGVDFETAWAEIRELEKEFKWDLALRQIQSLVQRGQLTDDQRRQALIKGDELSRVVVFSPSKHLAEPPLTFLPGTDLESIAQEHQLPLTFLREINGWEAEYSPTPGDLVKVMTGPASLHVDLPRQEIRLNIGGMYAGRVACQGQEVTVPQDSWLVADDSSDTTGLQVGSVAIVSPDHEAPSHNFLTVSAEDWQLLRSLASPSTEVSWNVAPRATPQTVAAMTASATLSPAEDTNNSTTTSPQPTIAVEPVDALRMEVFAPSEKATQGTPVNYGIAVTNLSDTETDMVQIVVNLSEGIEPLAVEGKPGRVAVGQAVFDPLTIPAGETVRVTVSIDTVEAGTHIVRPELLCSRPETKYATEVQLRVAEVAAVSADTDENPPEAEAADEVIAENPENPAAKLR